MKLQDFDFNLPKELIAHSPLKRGEARMLKIKNNSISDCIFTDVINELNPGDVLVLNDTKVINSLLIIREKNVKLYLNKSLGNGRWVAFAKNSKKINDGDVLSISDNIKFDVVEKLTDGEILIDFKIQDSHLFELLDQYANPPLPPYIKNNDRLKNVENYQTVYAKNIGAVASPTAGLHFSKEVLEKIEQKGVHIVFVTLHVGAGTFLPVKVENIEEHHMHSEYFHISAKAADIINKAKYKNNKVIAVGTTSLRVLESQRSEVLQEKFGDTDIFIYPGFQFKVVDKLITNFHTPKSTLFMLVCAFGGFEELKAAYQHAISNKYRFFSYGDSCFIERKV